MSKIDRTVDARGQNCPWPVLRVSRAAREMGHAGTIRLLADDPLAGSEVAHLCQEMGWRFVANPAEPAEFTIVLD